jgi:hypothetical protein
MKPFDINKITKSKPYELPIITIDEKKQAEKRELRRMKRSKEKSTKNRQRAAIAKSNRLRVANHH